MKLYPLIDLKKTEQPPFWVYNNYAYVYHQYLESYKKDNRYEVMGEHQKKPKLDEYLEIELSNNPNLKGINFIKNESFEWVEQTYYKHLAELEFMFVHDWNYSDCTINCFSALYKLNESEVKGLINDEIYNIKVYDFKNAELYPDSEQLDLLVKEYLKNIEPDLSFIEESELREKGYHLTKDKIYSFFHFHLNSCERDIYDFINHSIELTKEVWSNGNPKNRKRNLYFESWLNQTIDEYNLDRSKLNLVQKNVSENSVNQNLKVFDKMNNNYPLIELVQTEKYPFWVYNNFANLLELYVKPTLIEGKGERYFYGDPVKGYELQTQYSEKSQITFIKKSSFDWVVNRFMEDLRPVNNFSFWQNNDSTINIFSAKYEYEEEFLFNIQVYDFEENGLYPNPEKLDLVVKDYLKDIDYEVSASEINLEETDSRGHFTNLNKIYSFFDYHFRDYKGEPEDFVKHSTELINEVWKFGNLANKGRKEHFESWKTFVIYRHNLDRSKLGLEPITTEEPPQPQQNENITQPLVKIKWNGNSNVLSDIFIQLKLMNNQKGESLITNSDNDLAVFLKTNFSCFENTSLATIEKTLSNSKKEGTRPHKNKRIDINRTDL